MGIKWTPLPVGDRVWVEGLVSKGWEWGLRGHYTMLRPPTTTTTATLLPPPHADNNAQWSYKQH